MKPGQDCLNTQRSQKSLRLCVLILLTAWKLLGVEVVSVLMAEAQHVSWGHQSWWSYFALAHGWKILLLKEGQRNWARTDMLDIKDAEDAVNCIQMGSICSPQWPALISYWHRSDRCSIRTSIEWNYVVPSGPFPCKSLSNLNVIYRSLHPLLKCNYL